VVLSCHDSDNDFLSKRSEIIFEILSKSSIKMDQETKFCIYQEEKVPYYIIVNPDDLKAGIYKLENNEYSKQGDFNRECFEFGDLSCEVSVDFNDVFKRFR
jgi:Uma2 family endonuclease